MNQDFWRTKNVAISGASGFVGSAFSSALKDLAAKTVPLSRENGVDLLKKDLVVKKTKHIDILFHCAAVDGNSSFKAEHAERILKENVEMARNILKACEVNSISTVVLISSADVYPKEFTSAIKESDARLDSSDLHFSGYSLSKRISEDLVTEFKKNNPSTQVLVLRPTNIYGPGDDKMRMIPLFIKKLLMSGKLTLFNNGSEKRKFIFIDDLVAVACRLVEKSVIGTFNVAGDEVLSIQEVLNQIAHELNRTPILENSAVMQMNYNVILDTTKLKAVLDFTFTEFRVGLSKTIHYYHDKTN